MTLTFDLYLTLTLSLTFDLDDLKKYIFFEIIHFVWSHVQKRHSIRNVLQPTRSLYHFRFKSYGPLCDFHWFFWSHVTYKDDVVPQNIGSPLEAEFYKERLPTNQKILRHPIQKLWPIMWFSQKWWPWPWLWPDFKNIYFERSLNRNTSDVKKSGRSVQWCGL